MAKKPKILIYDIETSLLQAWVWRCGDQVVRHNQLVDGKFNEYGIICVSYCWLHDDKPAKCIDWGYRAQDTGKLIEKFDKIIKKADITIGKNSDRFDVKHINTQRMLAGLPGYPEWSKRTDDLEKQVRKHFGQGLPSVSLDYLSQKLGFGGKDKMAFDDWVHICQQTPGKGMKALKKMKHYCNKDVEDTRALWRRLEEHITPVYNIAGMRGETKGCVDCGSTNIIKNGTTATNKVLKQKFFCKDCGSRRTKANIGVKGPGRTGV